jgi:hypothetical protein
MPEEGVELSPDSKIITREHVRERGSFVNFR